MSERLYTEAEVAQLQQSEAQLILKGLLRNLTEVKGQRVATLLACRTTVEKMAVGGQIAGLEIAIAAVKRRVR